MADNDKAAGSTKRREMPDGIWLKCPDCGEILYRKEVVRNRWVCPKCSHHFRISADDYIELLVDPGSFEEYFQDIAPVDALGFRDTAKYSDRLRNAQNGNRGREAVRTGRALIEQNEVCLAVMDFSFLGGSMGSVVGEKLARLTQTALEGELPLLIVSCSGGARMQEGILSLMQMAKTAAQLARLAERGLPFISILTHPTTGGVSASFATLGDVILAEPKALVGFAGPRVIEQTIQQELPPGFQRSEFLLEHGMIDRIVARNELRSTLSQLIRFFNDARQTRQLG
ncbi:MAG: acetyl-CoA carboxylase carboxyltransferase subunit beta [Candidatus Eisenbacteria bacterium]|uniref:Acetyl-coenzyme A carboxylase carboxyl transferase subunit beta n=1 Tax=Eiseniibacteriota bacterium TaxID=2212470 RepID=A0A956M0Q7_UNCEI|nr:acetyl-CoA carboxylase carboxyltransferase subunit beta [Candidatus Eisenbacteria bacterium]